MYLNQPTKKLLLKAIEESGKTGVEYTVIISEDIMKQNKGGAKSFYAFKDYPSAQSYILSKPENQRCQYEILPGDKPTCFYMDIDHYDACGVNIVKEVVESFDKFLETVKLGTGKALVLKSLGGTKESYHFIWRTPWVLDTNITRKRLFELFVEYLKETDNPLMSCQNTTKDGKSKTLLDPAVYGKDQNFRCLHCSKFGDYRPLKPVAGFSAEEDLDYFVGHLKSDELIITLKELPTKTQVTKPQRDKIDKECNPSEKTVSHSNTGDFLSEFDSTLPNAFEDEITTIVRDDSLEYILKCIPNAGSGQPWNVWLSVGMALHREGMKSDEPSKTLPIIYRLFDIWSKSSSKYDAEQTVKSWESFGSNFKEIGYNKGTLIRLAKQVYPQLFQPDHSPFEDIETHYGSHVQRYNEQYVLPYDPSIQMYFESSPMGTGKTYQIAELIRKLKPKRVLCLSPKQSFATNFCAGLNEALELSEDDPDDNPEVFVNYLDLMKKKQFDNWHNVNRLVIQMESLFKIEWNDFEQYDLLVADEIESLLKCFNSSTMQTPVKDTKTSRLEMNLSTFEKIVQTSTTCIFADAFLSKRTLDVIDSIRSFEKASAKIRINEYIPQNRQAIKYASYQVFEDRMLKELNENKRIVVFWGSKRRGKEFELLITKHFPNKIVKFYHADADDKLDADLENVNVTWSDNIDVLMYSAKVTVGVNYTVPDHFDHMFVFAYAGGACARDVTQSILRVRLTKSNTLHYFADGRCYIGDCPTTYPSLKALTAWKVKNLRQIEDDLEKKFLKQAAWSLNKEANEENLKMAPPKKWKEEQPWMTHLYLLNQLEDNLSRTYYHQTLARYFVKCGYSIDADTSESKTKKKEKATVSYKDTPTCTNIEKLSAKVQRKQATVQDKLILKKVHFNRLLRTSEISTDKLEGLWNEHDIIEKLRSYKDCRSLTLRKLRDVIITFAPTTNARNSILFQLCEIMAIENPLQHTEISSEAFQKCIAWVTENLNDILKTFQYKSIGIDRRDNKAIESIIKRMFKETCGGLITHKTRVIKVDGKSVRTTTGYVLNNSLSVRYGIDINKLLV